VSTALLIFDSGLISPVTRQLSNNTINYLASTGSGVFASVPANEYNTLSAQLAEQQRILDAREALLREREIATRSFGEQSDIDYSTYILSTILFIIIVLLVLNYAMDWARVRRYSQYEVETQA
jgi:hypothetical protein